MITNSSYVFPNIIAKMAIYGDSISKLSRELGMNYQTLSARLRGKKYFELPEIFAIMQRYDDSFEHLFSIDNRKKSA